MLPTQPSWHLPRSVQTIHLSMDPRLKRLATLGQDFFAADVLL
jgi:hypothetical protein